jgi:rhodanese-related sulfurtransferase
VNLRSLQQLGLARVVGGVALVLGVLAAFAGTPDRARNARMDVESLARAVEHEEDHVTAIELAEWIKGRRPGLRVVDIRPAAEFAALHIPTAERIPLRDLSKTAFRRDETIVLYSEGGAHAAQGWVFLRALGHERVYFLKGGIHEWLGDVMNPTISSTAGDSARKVFARVSDLSRYFGGAPRVGASPVAPPLVPIPAARDSIAALRAKLSVWGRGC